MKHGFFITLEGGDGSGKSTQLKHIQNLLIKAGKELVVTREPGGVPEAEKIRDLLLQGNAEKWDPVSETLLFQAARVRHVKTLIEPSLLAGKWVLCDRYIDSTLVYQGISKGLGTAWVEQLANLTLPRIWPDLTLILDVDPEIGIKRAKARSGNETRFENMDIAFHKLVRDGFLQLAARGQSHRVVVDASKDQAAVSDTITSVLRQRFGV